MNKRRIMALIGSIILIVAGYFLTRDNFDEEQFVKDYMQGYMDIYYKNDSTLYKEVTDVSESDALVAYEESVLMEMDYFISYFEMDTMTSVQEDKLYNLMDKVYQKSKFEVGETKVISDSEYEIDVTISPMDIVLLVDEELANMIELSTEEELYTLILNWNDEIISLLDENVNNISYLEEEVVTVKVNVDDEDYYVLDDNDLGLIDNEIIRYGTVEENIG